VYGGQDFSGPSSSLPHSSSELYDPTTGVWLKSGDMSFGRMKAPSVLLPNGQVYAIGSMAGVIDAENTSERYDPASKSWTQLSRSAVIQCNSTV